MGIWYDKSFDGSITKESDFFSYVGIHASPHNFEEVFQYKQENIHILISIDGDIDNLDSLSKEVNVSSENIAAIISCLYLQYGYQGLYRLQGAASIILCDIYNDTVLFHRLFLRGLPLYFIHKNNRLTISSNPIGILHRDDISGSLNEMGIANLFSSRGLDFKDSIFTEIEALEHGELVIIKKSKIISREKRSLSTVFMNHVTTLQEEELFVEYRDLLGTSILDMLVPDKKYGIMLSSGMDSSTLAYFVAKQLHEQGKELTAYSWELPNDSADESENIKLLANSLGISLKLFNGEKFGPFDNLDNIPLIPDTPLVNLFWSLLNENYRRANADGIDVMIAGTYGDLLFRDDRNNLLKDIWNDKRFDIFCEILKERGLRGILGELRRFLKSDNKQYMHPLPWLTDKSRNLMERDSEFILEDGFENYTQALCPYSTSYLARDHYLSKPFRLTRIEPYQNVELLDFSLNVPTYLTFRHNQKKYFVRESMRGLLPEKIRIQPRVGNINTLVEKSFHRNREKVKEKIWKDPSLWNTYVKEEWMQEKLQDNSEVDNWDLYVIWNCITLGEWLKAIQPEGSLYEGKFK